MRRFTLRDLFWLTLVAGLAVGWWADRGRIVARYAEERAAIRDRAERLRRQALRLEQSLAADHRDYILCAVSYLDRQGGPDLPSKQLPSLAEWQAHAKGCVGWLRALPPEERRALERGFGEFQRRWSPHYMD